MVLVVRIPFSYDPHGIAKNMIQILTMSPTEKANVKYTIGLCKSFEPSGY